mgnify:CR=1 FL=1
MVLIPITNGLSPKSKMNNQFNFKVSVFVHAKYLAFRMSEGLNKYGVLDKIYTIYPKFKMRGYDIPKNKIVSFPLLGAVKYLKMRWLKKISDDRLSDFFSFVVSLTLKKPKLVVSRTEPWIFHAFSGYCERPLKKAKKLGAVTVIERGCTHIDEQQRIMAEEESLLFKRAVQPKWKYVYDRMKREYELADYIVVPSTYSQKSFLARGFSPKKVIVVPICSEKLTRPTPESEKPKRFTVLVTGGQFIRKGLFYVLEAWQKLNLPDAELLFKGSVPKEFEYLLEAKNIRRITKFLSDEEMTKLYNEAHVFVLPSIDEGFGQVVMEAMSAGLPVIVSKNVGSSDGVENGKDGFVVPIRSSDMIAERIKFFYDNPKKLEVMSEAAIQKSKFYSPEEFTKRIIAAYQSMLA